MMTDAALDRFCVLGMREYDGAARRRVPNGIGAWQLLAGLLRWRLDRKYSREAECDKKRPHSV